MMLWLLNGHNHPKLSKELGKFPFHQVKKTCFKVNYVQSINSTIHNQPQEINEIYPIDEKE